MLFISAHPHDIPLGHLVDLDELLVELLLLGLLVVPGVDLREPQVLDLVLAHEAVLHAALDVVYLELLTPLRHQLVLVQARVVPQSVLLTLVEVVQRERTLVRPTHSHTRSSIRHVLYVKSLLVWF